MTLSFNKLKTAGKTCCRLAESLQKFPKNHSHHDLPLQECSPHNMAEGNKENIERRIRKSSSTGEWNETCRAHNIPRRKTHSIQRVGKKEFPASTIWRQTWFDTVKDVFDEIKSRILYCCWSYLAICPELLGPFRCDRLIQSTSNRGDHTSQIRCRSFYDAALIFAGAVKQQPQS